MSINLEFKKDDHTKIELTLKEARLLYKDLHELFNNNNVTIPVRTDYYIPTINSNGNIGNI